MSPLRMPQHLADPVHIDTGEAHLRFELLEEMDSAVGRTERQVAERLDALRHHEAVGGSTETRRALLDTAADAVWRLIVLHEACDCADHQQLIARYGIPPEVMARIGARH